VGSTFTLTMPVWREAHPGSAVSVAQTSTPHPRPEGRLVLAIDDDPDVLALMSSRLAGSEFSVVTALGGQEGLKLAAQLRPDLITLDILMPGLDGWEVLRRLKSNPQLQHVPVVMMSIHENRALAFGMGAAECLVNPVSRERLLDVLGVYAAKGAGAPVLVVDDEADARALVRDILTAGGYRVTEAADGREALEAIARERPALVVLDLMMPELDGFEVLEHLGADPALRELPVVVLTALALGPADEARLKAGAQLVLAKGATSTEDLLAHLVGAIRRRLTP
jgi:CheY-like chemotaxis protein